MNKIYADGHGPETCNWNECRSESDIPCPFVKEVSNPPSVLKEIPEAWTKASEHEHQHAIPVEWAERLIADTESLTLRKTGVWDVTKLRCVCGDEIKR